MGFSLDCGGTEYLVLFGFEKCNTIFERSKYLIGLRDRITYVFSPNYEKIEIDLDDGFPLVKTLTLHNE